MTPVRIEFGVHLGTSADSADEDVDATALAEGEEDSERMRFE